jgi:hypothetical protein
MRKAAFVISNLTPEQRVVIGRNITLSAGLLYCVSRSIYYTQVRAEDLSGAQEIITADGNALGIWAALWAFGAVLCIADMVNGHTRNGLSMVVGVAFAWGFGYLSIWAFGGFHDFSLVSSGITWIVPAVFIFGFLIKVTALQDMLRRLEPKGAP